MKKIFLALLSLACSYGLQAQELSCSVEFNDADWVWSVGHDAWVDVKIENTADTDCRLDTLRLRITRDTGAEVYCSQHTPFFLPAHESTTLRYDLAGYCEIDPGFYHLYLYANGKNIVKNVTEVYGNQLTIDHYTFGVDPTKIVSAPDAQPDLKEFWDKARAELAATPMRPKVKELKHRRTKNKRAYVAQVRGLDGDIVQIDYTVPTKPGKYPVHIVNMGYSSKPWDLDMSGTEWIDVIVSSRGQGRNNDTNRFGDWVRYGLQSPETYYYRGAYLDCPRAIDYLLTLPQVDENNIFLEGGSQGGAYSMACAALDLRVRAIACYITFMSDFPDYFQIVNWPAQPIFDEQQKLGISDEQLYKTLSYFDIKNLAQWIECPVYLAIGLQDVTCPPHTNISGYNQLKGEKQLHIFPHHGHHVDYDYWNPTMYEWYQKWRAQ